MMTGIAVMIIMTMPVIIVEMMARMMAETLTIMKMGIIMMSRIIMVMTNA